MSRLYILALLLLLSFFTGCKKNNLNDACSSLHEAMQADNVMMAEKAINWFIDKLPSKTYNEQNLNQLAESLSRNCSITVTNFCFSCVLTLPEQSEMQIRYSNGTITIQKVIDISYTIDNMMKFVNMH